MKRQPVTALFVSAANLPQVFRRIAEGPDPTLDTDGDGLPDWLETQGIRRGNGSIVSTDPAAADTDGDGLSDGEEVGTRRTGPDGDYYDGITDPTKADTDGDQITDFEEVEIGTNPVSSDTDGDTLNDLTEINANFDPLSANADGDSFGDAAELAGDTDPFTYDLNGGEYVLAFAAGFAFGEAGQNMVNWGLLNPAYLQSFAFVGGWIASGFFILGDIRDTVVALANGDGTGALLNAIGLVPAAGDVAKIAKVFTDYVRWFDNLRGPLARWAVKQFDNLATVAASTTTVGTNTSGFMLNVSLLAPPTKTELIAAVLRALGWTDPVDVNARQLALARNDVKLLDNLLVGARKAALSNFSLNSTQLAAVNTRLNDTTLWDLTKNTFTRQEAFAVEATEEYLRSQGFTVLYTQRNTAVELLDNSTKVINNGPDILASKLVNGVEQLVVVEVKGGVNTTMINRTRLQSTAATQDVTQLTRDWISLDAEVRYLDKLTNAKNPDLQKAAQLIRGVRGGADYNAIIVGAGPNPTFGKIDKVLEEIVDPTNAVDVQVVKIAQ